jgi:hypothetical protein
MVPPNEITGFLRAEPFRPFRIRMASGQTYEIRHPEMLRVERNWMVYYTAETAADSTIRPETVSIMLIESISQIVNPTT